MQKSISFIFISFLVCSVIMLQAQPDRWQQKVKYKMDINMDVQTNRFTGRQSLEYWNNSPDTLKVLYYHLYWNAFQPGSMMDARSLELGKKIIMYFFQWPPFIFFKLFRKFPAYWTGTIFTKVLHKKFQCFYESHGRFIKYHCSGFCRKLCE